MVRRGSPWSGELGWELLCEACEGLLSTYCVPGSRFVPDALVLILGEVRHVLGMTWLLRALGDGPWRV